MTAVDFAAFVERLAQVSGEVILPFFRSAIGAEDKSRGGSVRSRHGGGSRRRGCDAAADRTDVSGPWRHRRGIRLGPSRRGICLGARPDRRDEEFHLRHADLGDPDWTHAPGPTGIRHDGATLHQGALLWRRQTRAAADSRAARGDSPPTDWTTRVLHTRACASLSEATLFTTSPMLIRDEFRPGGLPAGRKQGSAVSLRRRLLRLLRARRRLCRSRHRDQSKAARRRRPYADYRRGGRRHLDLGRRGPEQGRADSGGRRSASLRRGATSASAP